MIGSIIETLLPCSARLHVILTIRVGKSHLQHQVGEISDVNLNFVISSSFSLLSPAKSTTLLIILILCMCTIIISHCELSVSPFCGNRSWLTIYCLRMKKHHLFIYPFSPLVPFPLSQSWCAKRKMWSREHWFPFLILCFSVSCFYFIVWFWTWVTWIQTHFLNHIVNPRSVILWIYIFCVIWSYLAVEFPESPVRSIRWRR